MSILPDPIRIDLYLHRENLQQIPLAQGSFDSGLIEARILNTEGEAINLSDLTVRLLVRREVGENIAYYQGSKKVNDPTTAVFPLTEWITQEAGILYCSVELTKEEGKGVSLGAITLPFKLEVKRTYYGELISSNDFRYLAETIAEVDDIVNDAKDIFTKVEHIAEAEADRVEAEEEREAYWKETKPIIEEITEKAENASKNPAKIEENGNWYVWNYDTQSYADTGIHAKGDKGDAFQVGESFTSVEDLKNAYPTGDGNTAHLVENELYVWAQNDWKIWGNQIDFSDYQLKEDPALISEEKTIVSALNHLLEKEQGSGLLINSNFCVWQRGTSFTSPNDYTADRWYTTTLSGTPIVTPYQTLATTSTDKYRGIKVSGGSIKLVYKMDTGDLANIQGKTCTLSYGKNGVVTTPIAFVVNNQTVAEITLNDGDYLEWVKLEVGESSTYYKPPVYSEELQKCMRYFQTTVDSTLGMTIGYGLFAIVIFKFLVPMRTNPTIIVPKYVGSELEIAGLSFYTPTSYDIKSLNSKMLTIVVYAPNLPPTSPIVYNQVIQMDAEL